MMDAKGFPPKLQVPGKIVANGIITSNLSVILLVKGAEPCLSN